MLETRTSSGTNTVLVGLKPLKMDLSADLGLKRFHIHPDCNQSPQTFQALAKKRFQKVDTTAKGNDDFCDDV